MLLESGRTDAFASDKLLLLGAQIQNPQTLTMLPDDLSIEPYAIVLPRGDWRLRLAVNAALVEIYRSSQITEIFNRWFAQVGLQPDPLVNAMYILGRYRNKRSRSSPHLRHHRARPDDVIE